AAQPESDPGALIIAGHSEGGMQALLLARAARPAPAGLVLLEPQDMRLLDLVRLQIDGQLDAAVAAGQYDPAQAATDKAVLARLVTDFHARRPLRYTGMSPNLADFLRTAIFAAVATRYVRSDDAVYPPRVATRIPRHTRILVTCGTADTQVPCS